MIYFMQSVDGGAVKIGFTDNIPVRHAQLENEYGCHLAILATMEGGRDVETEIHKRFEHLRFDRTEQFRPASDLMEFIGRPILVGANPDAVEVMPSSRTPMAIQIRGDSSWKRWVEKLSDFDERPVATLIERALREYAERIGFTDIPPKR